jgi:hypothetical protein
MKYISGMCIALLPLMLVFAQQPGGQQPVPAPRMVLIPGKRVPAPPPQPEPGDAFYLDREQGQVVIERRTASGEIKQYRYQKPSAVDPLIISSLELIGNGSVRYSYTLTNGLRARQPISHFAVGTERPDLLSNGKAPDGWRVDGDGVPGNVEQYYGERAIFRLSHPRYNFNAHYERDLALGQGAEPFTFEGPFLPGLTSAYTQSSVYSAWVGPEPERPLSRWLEQKLEEANNYEVATRQTAVIGPKFPIHRDKGREPVLKAIASELRLAATMPEFQGLEANLTKLAEQVELGGPPSPVSLRGLGATPLQRAFFQAMALNLEFAGTL